MSVQKQTPNRVIIHHTAISYDGTYQANRVDADHKARGFPESSLGNWGGYHYLIESDGMIAVYRMEDEVGAHDKDENFGSIGVCLAGNFNEARPSVRQEIVLADLLEKIMKRWNIPLERIEPHRWGDTTDCPGKLLPDMWARIIYLKYQISWTQKFIDSLKKLLP